MCCVFLAEKTLQRMSVHRCGIVFGLIIEPWSWENRRKAPVTFPPFPSKSFVAPSCMFSSPARSGVGGAAVGVLTPVGFYISKHCHRTPPNKLAGSSTTELVIEYDRTVPDFILNILILFIWLSCHSLIDEALSLLVSRLLMTMLLCLDIWS